MLKCDKCKSKIVYTYFKHCTGNINFCYSCGLNAFEKGGRKFYVHDKFSEFVLEFESSERYEDIKKNEKMKKEYKDLIHEIAILFLEYNLGTPKIHNTKLRARLSGAKKHIT